MAKLQTMPLRGLKLHGFFLLGFRLKLLAIVEALNEPTLLSMHKAQGECPLELQEQILLLPQKKGMAGSV